MRLISALMVVASVGVPIVQGLEFSPGASVDADVSLVEGTWVLIIVPDGALANLTLDSQGYVERVMDVHRIQPRIGPGANLVLPGAWLPGSTGAGPVSLALAPRPGWSAIFIDAGLVTVEVKQAQSTLIPYGYHSCVAYWQTPEQRIADLLPPSTCPSDRSGAASLIRVDRGTTKTVELAASNVSRVVVHNWSVACSDDECPSGGHREYEVVGGGPAGYVERFHTSYGEWTFEGAHLAGLVNGVVVVAGGASIDVNAAGVMRLPLASGTTCSDVEHCIVADDQTLRAWGELELNGIRPASADARRLSGELSGTMRQAQLDSAIVDLTVGSAAVAAGGILALAAAVKLVWGALTSRTRHPLSHPNRRKLYDHILANPGDNFRAVVRGTGIPSGTARHHLAILVGANLIQEHAHHATLRYFENHGRFDESWNTVVMLREPGFERLHAWLLKHPGSMQRAVLDAAAQWGWSRSTTQHRLARLATEGLVDVKLQGRLKLYTARRQAPVPV